MSQDDDDSPGGQSGAESFEQGDEALDEASRIDPDFIEEVEQDPSLDPALQVDARELAEAGVELDDPEAIVTLQGGMDDPDGLGQAPGRAGAGDDEGWDLDAPVTPGDAEDAEPTE